MTDKEYSTTEAQRKASKKYEQKNPIAKQYRNKKSATKSFILNIATEEDLLLIEDWLNERKKTLL